MPATLTMFIREDLSQVHPGGETATVVVEADGNGDWPRAIAELNSAEARKRAISHAAAQGVVNPGTSGIVAPFPVNVDSVPLDEVRGPDGANLERGDPRLQIAAYQIRFPIQRGR